jgi:magnesium-transporting ATPase (P-type)
MTQWWQIGIEQIAKNLGTDLSGGLASQEATARLTKYGPNQLQEKKGDIPLEDFLRPVRGFYHLGAYRGGDCIRFPSGMG